MANKNFLFSERVKLEYILDNRLSYSAIDIARILDKSRSTIYYELANFKENKHDNSNNFSFGSNNNAYRLTCEKLKKFPFVCNGCPKENKHCSYDKCLYNAYSAQDKAHKLLVNTRKDTKSKRETAKKINNSVVPLIKDGISIHVAKTSVNNCPYSESTIRRYIENGEVNAKRIDLPRAVRFRVKKSYNYKTPKLDINVLNGRTYNDYKEYIKNHNKLKIIQVDSVIGKANDKTALLTIYFCRSKLQLGILYNKKHSNVTNILAELLALGAKYHLNLFDVILTDNGSEFKNLWQLESQFFVKVFYCDPYASYQKAGCEKNHGFIRRIIPKSVSLDKYNQNEINEFFSHINSYPRASLANRSPYDLFTLEYNSIILSDISIIKIPVSKIKLKYQIKH